MSDLTVTFDARLQQTRGTGSCWVRIPWIGQDIDFEQEGYLRLSGGEADDEAGNFDAPPARGLWRLGQVPIPFNDSFGPELNARTWMVVNAPWKDSYREITLVWSGLLMAVGFEILVRARRRMSP